MPNTTKQLFWTALCNVKVDCTKEQESCSGGRAELAFYEEEPARTFAATVINHEPSHTHTLCIITHDPPPQSACDRLQVVRLTGQSHAWTCPG
jgi:hypothetical protein